MALTAAIAVLVVGPDAVFCEQTDTQRAVPHECDVLLGTSVPITITTTDFVRDGSYYQGGPAATATTALPTATKATTTTTKTTITYHNRAWAGHHGLWVRE